MYYDRQGSCTKNFNVACRVYEEAKGTIRELSTIMQSVSPEFSFEIAMRQFDLVLQGILLRTAMEDGYFLDEERQFIEKITDYGDIIAYFNKKGIKISWSDLNGGTDESRKELSLTMVVALKEIADDFVTPFAIVDAAFPKDYCKEITRQIGTICFALAGCDGDTTDSTVFKSEAVVAVALVTKIIEEKWKEVVDNCGNN